MKVLVLTLALAVLTSIAAVSLGQTHYLKALRRDLESILGSWDAKLKQTPKGQRADLLESLVAHPGLTPGPRTGRIAGKNNHNRSLGIDIWSCLVSHSKISG